MLEEFLANQTAEGSLDSSGSFTISAEQARRKMAESGLDSSLKGLLKLVQLGVESSCRSIKITLGKDDIAFTFQDPCRGLLEDCTLGEELQGALLACVYSGFAHATYQTETIAWRLHRDRVEPFPAKSPSGVVRVVLRRWSPSGFWEALRHNLAGRTEDYTKFLSYLGYCPIPLELDGARPVTEDRSMGVRALDLRLRGPGDLRYAGVRLPFGESTCVVRLQDDRTIAPPEYPAWEVFAAVDKLAEKRLFGGALPAWTDSQSPGQADLGLLYSPLDVLPGGIIDVVEKGVLVGRLPWPHQGHLSGVISCLGLDTDLSGLALVHNSKTTDLLAYLRDEVADAAKRLVTHPTVTPTVRERLEALTSL